MHVLLVLDTRIVNECNSAHASFRLQQISTVVIKAPLISLTTLASISVTNSKPSSLSRSATTNVVIGTRTVSPSSGSAEVTLINHA